MSASDSIETNRVLANKQIALVYGEKNEYATSASNYFESDQPESTHATKTITLAYSCSDLAGKSDIKRFKLTRLQVFMGPANAVTYKLILSDTGGAAATTIEVASRQKFRLGSGMAKDVLYDVGPGGYSVTAFHGLPAIFNLETANTMYYQLDWSAAPGDTAGFIHVYGEPLK